MKIDMAQESVVERVAALDIGKAEVVCCVRVPAGKGHRSHEIRTFPTMTSDLLDLASWLAEVGVTRVVMEATSDYWKPVFYVLEGGFDEVWLVNARDVKHLPGRPKTDRLDAQWLARLAERGMLRPSFVPPQPIRELRDLTRYRVDLVTARSAEKQRIEKLLEDAGVKLSVVASDIFGVSGRRMLTALIAGERDPHVLADLAVGTLRKKQPGLERSFQSRFNSHHGFLLGQMLARVDDLTAAIAKIDERIAAQVAGFRDTIDALTQIPGVGPVNAIAIIAEIGLDMGRFPTPGHLASWAKFTPTTSESAGRARGPSSSGHGNRYLARALGEAVMGARRTDTFLGERYRRIARRRGSSRAMVAVGRSILVIAWHLIQDPTQPYVDLGPDWHALRDIQRAAQRHARALQQLGFQVTLTAAAA